MNTLGKPQKGPFFRRPATKRGKAFVAVLLKKQLFCGFPYPMPIGIAATFHKPIGCLYDPLWPSVYLLQTQSQDKDLPKTKWTRFYNATTRRGDMAFFL